MIIKKRVILILRFVLPIILVLVAGLTFYNEVFKKDKVIAAEIGHLSPDFTLKQLDGVEHSLIDYRGRGVVVNFWATYCPPCEKELPYLENAYREYQNQGIVILGVNAAEPKFIVNRFVAKKNVSFPILLDRNGTVLDQYKVINLPTTFFLNAEGEVVEKISGELTEEKIKEGIKLIKP